MQTTLAPAATYRLGFTSLDREISVEDLPVSGSLPPWLAGSLLRNGPACFEVGTEQYQHWFDGSAMLHRFTVADGRVSYANRFLRTPAFVEADRLQRIACAEFGTTPHRSPLGRLAALFRPATGDNANVNVVPYADGYLALTESPNPVAVDGMSLETRGVVHYDDAVAGQVTTAHTHHDRSRRATFNIVIEFGRTCIYKVVRIEDGTLRRVVVAELAVDQAAYLHAFATTERYVVVAEYPLVVRPLDLLLQRKPFIENYRWLPGRGTRFHVFHKDGGGAAGSFEGDAFFAFHHINAFEEGGAIVLDIAAYGDASVIGDLALERVRDARCTIARPAFRRFRLIPGRSAAEIENILPQTIELPRVAARYEAADYRYVYGVDTEGTYGMSNRLVKLDLGGRNTVAWTAPHAYPGEPVFVERPGGTDEDDGVVLSVVLDAEAAASYLVALDARDFTELARVHVPHHIPFGFHGTFRSQPRASSTIV